MELFEKDPTLVFEKSAGTELEEDPTAWPRQVLTELYRSIPEISDYVPEVNFLKVDKEQGYGLGVVVVSSSTNTALQAQTTDRTAAQKALIPVIVKGHTLLPLDVIMTTRGKMYPLTADRLREALFRPETFEMITDDWGDASLWNMFYPPGRGDSSFGSGMSQGAGGSGGVNVLTGPGMKFSSSFELLSALSGTILYPDIEKLSSTVESTPGLLKAAGANPSLLEALRFLSEMPAITKEAADAAEDAAYALYPAQVVQLGYDEITEKYWAKTASRESGHVQLFRKSRGDFLKFAGPDLTNRVDTEGTLTVAEKDPEVVVIEGPEGPMKICEQPGHYTVYTANRGKTLSGWVIPGLMDGKGNRLPIALFTNGKITTTQDQIAVSTAPYGYIGGRCDLPDMPPKGAGCFWFDPTAGTGGPGMGVRATIPLEVKGATHNEDGSTTYRCMDITGEELNVVLMRGARGAVAIPSKNELILPASAGFVAMGEAVPLVRVGAMPEDRDRMKGASDALAGRVTIAAHGDDVYSLRFSVGTPKLASMFTQDTYRHSDAAFALCCGGLGAQDAYDALSSAVAHGTAQVGARDVGTVDYSEAYKTAAARVAEVRGLQQNLVKEAVALPDIMTVDAVLSLGFINSENVRTFVSRIPYLENALSMICEFVLASRVGLTEIPESACSRCARALNDTIQGLKALALREIQDVT